MDLIRNKDDIFDYIEANRCFLQHNQDLLDIYEGDLERFVLAKMYKQLTKEAYKRSKERVSPINVLSRITDKQSKIYQQSPRRMVMEGNDRDSDLLTWYEDSFDMNTVMNTANEFFNLQKGCLVEPFIYKGMPKLRAIPYNAFLPYSWNDTLKTEPTALIIYYGQGKNSKGQPTEVYHVVSDEQFLIINSDREIMTNAMAEAGNPNGINPYGKIPYIYVNKSKNLLIPKPDTDMMAMTTLLPILLTDLNYAVMMQAFSIIYTMDVDNQDFVLDPSVILDLKSDGDGEKKPEIGSIKPQVDISEVLNLIQSQFSLWLNTKGIKPGAVGQLTAENFASGISKMVDEMDVSENRQSQISYFEDCEKRLFDLVFNYQHPLWSSMGMIENRYQMSSGAYVETLFAEQLPLISRGQVVSDLRTEIEAGFISKRRAIKKLNPKMSDTEIDALIAEIDEEKTMFLPEIEEDGSDETTED